MNGICKISENLKRDIEIVNKNTDKITTLENSIINIYDTINKQETNTQEYIDKLQNEHIKKLQNQIDAIKKEKDVVTVEDLNSVIEDIRESFLMIIQSTPRNDITDINAEIKLLKDEINKLKPQSIITVDASMEVVHNKIPKLNLQKNKSKTFQL